MTAIDEDQEAPTKGEDAGRADGPPTAASETWLMLVFGVVSLVLTAAWLGGIGWLIAQLL